MNLLDIIIVLMVIGSVLHGLSKGLLSQVINLAAFVFALTIASTYGATVGQWIDHFIALPAAYLPLIGFIVTLVVVEGLIRGILRFAGHLIPGILTGSAPNRLLGIIPALAETALFLTIAINLVTSVPSWVSANQLVRTSKFAPPIETLGAATQSVVNRILGDKLPNIPAPPPPQFQ